VSVEPKYIAQVEQDPELHLAWWRLRMSEARSEGCTWFRYTWHERNPSLALIEAWEVRPDDGGAFRWQLAAAPALGEKP
jgi:hypothetical protein